MLQIIAITSLFLAGKVEETPKKLRDVIAVSHSLRHHGADIKPDSQVCFNALAKLLPVPQRKCCPQGTCTN